METNGRRNEAHALPEDEAGLYPRMTEVSDLEDVEGLDDVQSLDGSPASAGAAVVMRMMNVLERGVGAAHVRSVFGEPRQEGDRTLIPVASVFTVFGFGGGSSEPDEQEKGGAGGGGGGGLSFSTPHALIEIAGGEVKIRNIVNSTLVSVAGIVMAMWNLFWIARTVRSWLESRSK